MNRLAFALVLVLALALACNRSETASGPAAVAKPAIPGNATRGKELIAQYGCNVCHAIPGLDGAQGALGPSLAGIATRPTLSVGTVKNTPENLTQYIQNPASLNPQSSMPPMGLAPGDAQDIVAFLMTLR